MAGLALRHGLMAGLAVTGSAILLGLLFAEIFPQAHAMAPGLFIVPAAIAVIVVAFQWGMRSALASVALLVVFQLLFYSFPQPARILSPEDAIRVFTTTLAVTLASILVGTMKARVDEDAARAIERERRSRLHLEETNRELAERNRALIAANSVLKDFTYLVSHDLKEPVRAMSFMHQALAEDHRNALDGDGRELLDRCIDADERLAGLLQSLLEYARATRIEAGDLRPVHVEEALRSRECVTRYEALVRERDARLDLPEPNAPPVRATLSALTLILGNLVVNAIRHNSRHDPRVRVKVREGPVNDAREGEVLVTVEDNGPGFPDDVRDRFAEGADAAGDRSGAGGFGLIIVQRTVERLGGRVQLERSSEGGAAVHVILPAAWPVSAARDDEVDAGAAPETAPPPHRAPPTSSRARPGVTPAG